MGATAEDWDSRIDRLTGRLPTRVGVGVAWLRKPSRRPVRLTAAAALIGGGLLSFLPVLGLWMLPLGLALLSDDIPALKPPLERAAQVVEKAVERIRRR